MNSEPQQRSPSAIRLPFIDRKIYVLVMLAESRRHYVTEVVPEGEALLCFLSPIDAHIEGILRVRQGQGQHYQVPVSSIVPVGRFKVSSGVLVIGLHLGWPTRNKRLMMRPSDTPCRYMRSMVHVPTRSAPYTFEVDDESLAVVDRLHESGGMFSWREISDAAWHWEPAGLQSLAERAERSSQAFVHPG